MLSQKSTVLCILDILKRFSDEYHPISADKIIEKLRVIYDISMERRAVYRNISVLNEMGIEVVKYSDNRGGYCLLEHDFEPIEIRMLCDALTSSHLMSEKQNKKLISKLLSTLSVYQANEIKSTVYINSKQTINTSIIFYNLEVLNSAVSQCKCISFDFMKYNLRQHRTIPLKKH